MDVLRLADPKFEAAPEHWLGVIGYAAAHAVGHFERDPEWEMGLLRDALRRYVASDACPHETRDTLTKEMR